MYVYVISVERFDVRNDVEQTSLPITGTPQKVCLFSLKLNGINQLSLSEVLLKSFDFSNILTSSSQYLQWTLIRHYNEFYILESKLVEFHGSMIKTESLPPRRFFNYKSRVYMESRRENFERFIQLLTKQASTFIFE